MEFRETVEALMKWVGSGQPVEVSVWTPANNHSGTAVRMEGMLASSWDPATADPHAEVVFYVGAATSAHFVLDPGDFTLGAVFGAGVLVAAGGLNIHVEDLPMLVAADDIVVYPEDA